MELDEMLKQATSEETTNEETQKVEIQVMQDGTTNERIANETGEIYLIKNSEFGLPKICLDKEFEKGLADDLKLAKEVNDRLAERKEMIIKFIEQNDMGSFKGELVNVKYSSATTTTSIDSARLKKELPDIAAKYSKVSSRKSSVSIELVEMPVLENEILA